MGVRGGGTLVCGCMKQRYFSMWMYEAEVLRYETDTLVCGCMGQRYSVIWMYEAHAFWFVDV